MLGMVVVSAVAIDDVVAPAATAATLMAAVVVDFCGVEFALGESASLIDGGLYGEPGSEVSDDAVLESVQLNVATPLKRKDKILGKLGYGEHS